MLVNIPYLYDTLPHAEAQRVVVKAIATELMRQAHRTLEDTAATIGMLHDELCTRAYDDSARPEYVRSFAESITDMIDALFAHRNRLRDLAAAQESVQKWQQQPASPVAAPTEEAVAA